MILKSEFIRFSSPLSRPNGILFRYLLAETGRSPHELLQCGQSHYTPETAIPPCYLMIRVSLHFEKPVLGDESIAEGRPDLLLSL